MPKEYPWGKGTPTWVRDAALNDSDKSFTVPTGKAWLIQYVRAQIATSADVGNRSLLISFTNGATVLHNSGYTGNIAASQTGIILAYPKATPSSTVGDTINEDFTAANVLRITNFPDMLLSSGCVVRVFDRNVIAAGADDMIVVLHYVEYDA